MNPYDVQVDLANMPAQELYVNILQFNPLVESVSMSFSKIEKPWLTRFRGDIVPAEAQKLLDKKEAFESQFLYCNFNPSPDEACVSVNLREHLSIAIKYFTSKIEKYFLNKSIIVAPNFLKDNEVWIQLESTDSLCNTYRCFVVRVQYNVRSNQFELQVSYETSSRIAKRSVFDLMNDQLDSKLFINVLYDNKIIPFDKLPPKAQSNLKEVYPVINKKLFDELGLKPSKKDSIGKYQKYHDHINDFLNQYLTDSEFKAIIPHSGTWQAVEQSHCFKTTVGSDLLVFAHNHKGNTPKNDIKRGPYQLNAIQKVKFIFIVHEDDASNNENTSSKKLFNYFTAKEGSFSIPNTLGIPLSFDRDRNITFSNRENPLSEILEKLSKITFPAENKYIAIYITPISRDKVTSSNEGIYYRIKEELLKKRVVSQVVERESIFEKGFQYSIVNIGIAILAKQGSIPWCLDRPVDDELIIGVGAFRANKLKASFIGSAFCFANDGTFKGFDAFPESNLFALVGSIREAVKQFHQQNKKAKRLVIHFYKTINKRDLKAIQQELYNKLELDIPIVILTINKTESKDIVVFDSNYLQKMPLSGTFVSVAENTYLLCNNARFNNLPVGVLEGYPLPIKIKLQSTDKELLQDMNEVGKLIEQTYQFGRMYWKSVIQQSLPVTIRYPEMLAKMIPHFKDKQIPPYGKDSLWFL